MVNEIQLILEAASYKHRVKSAMGTHQRLMAKFEKRFDETLDGKLEGTLASVLAKMSEASLKAEGEFSDGSQNNVGVGLQIVMNIGNPKEEPPAIDVEVQHAG